MNLKLIATFAPFLNAVLYGLYYAMLERNYQRLPLSTVVLLSALTSLFILVVLTTTKLVPLDFSFARNKHDLLFVIGAQTVSVFITILMYVAIRYASATYLAFGELGYPLFVALFAYLLFGTKELNWTSAAGGALILIGCAIMFMGQTKV